MDLIKQINQSPELGGLLRALLKEGAGKSDYRFNLTARRLKQLAIGGSLEQNDEWLARLEWLAQHGWFQFKPAADERLEGSRISLSAEQHARLDEQRNAIKNTEYSNHNKRHIWFVFGAEHTLPLIHHFSFQHLLSLLLFIFFRVFG